MWAGKGARVSLREIILYGLLGALITGSQVVMAALPNVNVVTVLILLCVRMFGLRALYPVYTFVLLEGLIFGFGLWMINYLYVWAILALGGLLLMRAHAGQWAWIVLAGVFGMSFGALCAIPYFFMGGWSMGFAYWVSGIPYDLIHGVSNAVLTAALLPPLTKLAAHALPGMAWSPKGAPPAGC